MKRSDTRALSTIVITLILIVLALIAIGVVWGVVRNIIKKSSEQVQTGSLLIDLDITKAYEQLGTITVNVRRNSGKGEITQIKFVLSDGGDSEVITKEAVSLEELDSQIFSFSPVKLIASTVLTVSVAPVFKTSDGSEIVGEVTDTYTISRTDTNGDGIPDDTEDDENPSEECTPDCGSRICGPAPNGCDGANACGVCATGTCSEDGLSCIGCTPISSCDEGKVCGTQSNGCGGILECGVCPAGQLCNSYGTLCEPVAALNSGTIEEVWPGSSGLYFGSSSLPTSISYQNKYIKFPGSAETSCLLVVIYRFPVDGYDKSHIGFNFETLIQTGDDYSIFETFNECQA